MSAYSLAVSGGLTAHDRPPSQVVYTLVAERVIRRARRGCLLDLLSWIEDMQLRGCGPNNVTLLHVGPNPASVYGRNEYRPLTMTNYNSFRNLYLHR